MQGMPLRAAAVRMKYPSVRGSLPNGVLMTRSTRPASISSTALGLPSDRLRTVVTGTPALDRSPAVPSVARRVNPRSARRRAGRTTERLSRLATEMNTVPPAGRTAPVASWAFARASPRSAAMPMTSPVERISGPRMMSTPGNLLKGNTLSLTEKCVGTTSPVTPSSSSVLPAMTKAARHARGECVSGEDFPLDYPVTSDHGKQGENEPNDPERQEEAAQQPMSTERHAHLGSLGGYAWTGPRLLGNIPVHGIRPGWPAYFTIVRNRPSMSQGTRRLANEGWAVVG